MADVAAAEAQQIAPADPGNRGAGRDARRGAAMARLQGSISSQAEAQAPAEPATPAAEPVKAAEPTIEKPDPATDRGLRQVEQAKKKFFDEQAATKAELAAQAAEVARLRKEAEGKLASRADLKGLKPTELLDALDHYGEDELDILSRLAYARTKAGKADPRAQVAAQEANRAQGGKAAQAELAELRETVKNLEAELRGEFTKRDSASFAERWLGETIKAIPADKPSFLAKLHATEPDTAKRELLAIGQELEKANDGEAPTHAEVIAEFEKRKHATLKAMGLDPEALLTPPKTTPAPAAKPAPARTLDVTTSAVTRPANAPKTREERRERALANLRDRQRATADQS